MMNAHLLRRAMAALYDLLLLFAIIIAAVAIAMLVNRGTVDQDSPFFLLFQLYLLVISFTYYAWFWINGGQTPGMKTWRIRLYRKDGFRLKHAVLYAFAAMLSLGLAGTGFLLALFHPQRRTLHDLLTGCEMQDTRTLDD